MEPHLYLKRGKKNILLVRYEDRFHFITLDHRMHGQARKWLLACPRTEEEMDLYHLSRSTVPVRYVRGVAAGGSGRGQVVQFYFQDGKRRYELAEDCELSDMSELFAGLESFAPPQKDSNWSDPRLARQDPMLRRLLWPLGWAMNVAAVAAWFALWAVGFEIPWLCWAALLLVGLSMLLYCLLPDYFMLFPEKRKYGQKRGAVCLLAPFLCPLGMIQGAISCYCLFDWWRAWLLGAAAVGLLVAILRLTAPVFRKWDQLGMLVIAGLLLSGGPVLALNSLLETAPAREIRTEVIDREHHSGSKSPDVYELIVIVDGQTLEIPVNGETYRAYETGEPVTVEVHEGAFGIGFAQIK